MADKTISQLDSVATVDGTEDFEIQQGSLGKKITLSQINKWPGNKIEPLTGTVSANTVYIIAEGEATYLCVIPKEYLVASSNGPFTLTLTTGVGGKENVIVPITKTGDTILSPSLIFNVYVDSAGNVMSDNFFIVGSNANGTWERKSTGEMSVRRSDGSVRNYSDTINSNIGTYGWSFFYAAVAYTFPAAFSSAPESVVVNCKDGIGNAQAIITTGFNAVPYVYYITYTINSYSANGRWRA